MTYVSKRAGAYPLFNSRLEQVAATLERGAGTDALVEVGCGKTYFLELLESRGYFDINPAKCSKFVAASGLGLDVPEQAMATLAPG